LQALEAKAIEALQSARTLSDLEAWRVAFLGRRSQLAAFMSTLGTLAPEQRGAAGQSANEAKRRLEAALSDRRHDIEDDEVRHALQSQRLDVTLPGRWPALGMGRVHPITRTILDSVSILRGMGFDVTTTPEIELDYYNFEALNTPPWHPARDLQDTLYVDYPRVLMRTQATAYQARVLPRTSAPVRLLNVGRCHRSEATDATHEWMFYQIDGLVVDKGVTMSDLRGTLTTFATRFFGRPVKTRFRCDYFPFVEPGVDFAISCHRCDGDGGPSCPICHGSGWLELLGAGMVHPKVLDNVGYDSTVYSGFAWGMGVDRLTLVKHGITDIRMFYANDVRFLEQF
jgi:phenylalanyl-tRNA synthetase alpha chain